MKLVFIVLILISVCSCKNDVEEDKTYPDIYDYLNSITLETFQTKIDNNETFIVYVGRPTCSDCEMLDTRLINDSKNDENIKKILYLNITSLYKYKNKWNDFKIIYGIDGTPAFISFVQGKVDNTYTWTEENGFNYELFIEWLYKVNK